MASEDLVDSVAEDQVDVVSGDHDAVAGDHADVVYGWGETSLVR